MKQEEEEEEEEEEESVTSYVHMYLFDRGVLGALYTE